MNHFWARWTKMESDHVLQSGWGNWLLNIMFTGGRCFLGLSTIITHETSVIPFAFYPVIALERYSIFSHESIFFTYGFAPTSLGVCLTCSYLGSMTVCVVIRGTIGTLDFLITIFVRLYHINVCMCVWYISRRDDKRSNYSTICWNRYIVGGASECIAINSVDIVLKYEDKWNL